MTIETDFRAVLAAHAPLTALVTTRISKNAVEQGADLPIVVFAAEHDPQQALDGPARSDRVTFTVECWAKKAETADAVADQVVAAIAAHDAASVSESVTVLARGSVYDGELKLDGTVLTVEWWD